MPYGCSIYVPSWLCFLFRGITTIIQQAYSPLFVATIIERAIATASIGKYEHSRSRFVYYLLGVMLASTGFLYLGYGNLSLPEKTAYCSGVTRNTSDGVALAGYIQTALEAVAILGFLLVLVVNQQLDKR